MIRVYIAGPYTSPDPAANVHAAMRAFHILARAGVAPFCPHLSHFLHMHEPREYEFWMRHDFEWLSACHVLVRLHGESSGADREVKRAIELGIPIVLWEDLSVQSPDGQRSTLEQIARDAVGGTA